MHIRIPTRWRPLLLLAAVITMASISVMAPVLFTAALSEQAQTTGLNVRERARMLEGASRGRMIPLGGRGRTEPLRRQGPSRTGLQRSIRETGTLPALNRMERRLIKRRSTTTSAVRNAVQ